MSEQYIGEIRQVGFNFAPVGWLMCDGSLQSIAQNDALYALLGTTYGGDGQTTFGLPDLRGRAPISQGTGPAGTFTLGQSGGQESVTLTTQQMAMHPHGILANGGDGGQNIPTGNYFGVSGTVDQYAPSTETPLTPTGNVLAQAGGNQPHENRQPYVVVNFIIATVGIYPSQS